MNEAETRIRQFANVSLGASIQERAQYAQRQKEKWDKIFADLQEYMANKLPIVIYDFSTVKDTITDAGKRVNLAVSPGVKIIPNRTVLAVWKAVGEEWLRVRSVEENRAWTESVRTALAGSTDSQNVDNVISYDVILGLYDSNGDPVNFSGPAPVSFTVHFPREAVLSQSRYYTGAAFSAVSLNRIAVADITTSDLPPRIDRVRLRPRFGTGYYYPGAGYVEMKQQPPVLSVPEWERWLAAHGGR
jgi:hypothetical protein